MHIYKTCVWFFSLCAVFNGLAWDSVESFEVAATNALNNVQTLVDGEFGRELTNYIASTTDHGAKMAAFLVLGERQIANYNETMDEHDLQNAWTIATNVCALSLTETNKWYCWQAKLLQFTCHAQNDEMQLAYDVSSNACSNAGACNFISSNLVSVALLNRNKTPDLTVGQALILSKALAAAMIGRKDEAAKTASLLPLKYQNMVSRAADDN